MYRNGEGVPEDDAEAVKLFRKAAEQGYANAQYNLGVMHHFGEGTPENYVQAYLWYNLAATGGNERAKSDRDILRAKMTPEQIAEAQDKSTEEYEKIQKRKAGKDD